MTLNNEDTLIMERWFTKQDYSEGTEEIYERHIKKYVMFTGKTLKQLINEADKEEDEGIRRNKRQINNYLIDFKSHLTSQGLAPSTINGTINAVIAFYDTNEIWTPHIKKTRGDICLDENYSPLLTKDEIRTMANAMTPRNRAIVYLMALSGMASMEIRQFKIQDLVNSCQKTTTTPILNSIDIIQNKTTILKDVLTVHIKRKKVRFRHITFIPPEAMDKIILYLQERLYGPNENIRIIDNYQPLFLTKEGRPMTRGTVGSIFKHVGFKLGWQHQKGFFRPWRSHALRRYFISTVINELDAHDLANFLAGHKPSKVNEAYWRPNEQKLKERYLEALPYLSLEGAKVVHHTDEKMQEQDKKIKALEKALKDYMDENERK